MIDSKFSFELWVREVFCGDNCKIVVDTNKNVYAYTYEYLDHVIDNIDYYTWYEFKPIS